jgi:ribosomal protein L32
MKTRHNLLSDLRQTMAGFVGQTFTEEMRQRIRMDAAKLMNTAFDEGQAVMAHHICANHGTDKCPMTDIDYDETVCRQCNQDGGFEI